MTELWQNLLSPCWLGLLTIFIIKTNIAPEEYDIPLHVVIRKENLLGKK